MRRSLFAFLLVAGLFSLARAEQPAKNDILQLIQRLGSPAYAERRQAAEALSAIGRPAQEAVRQAAEGPDAERRRGAAQVLKQIEKRLLVEKLLGPTRLRLVLQDVPLHDALSYL